ncbi:MULTISPECIES: sodium:alanine symporter family protein [unclassified Photobacterium]|uniref:alanine/glycine:cation symporter family protein n=1 Tax=unclassified Photobacterium TaxID=2628852 RepID=UPI000D166B9E|nr:MULTISPECIES: sodium:alanine symporter family protein [unclassified Photobacterium]PSV26019.1 sodium:alanine symporter family protein [Photobacterium sp. GB-56]PSV31063.1 sodium:alanine symporter family protein [Photobacterium sp. GB-72]PSV36931.1 sodium:alanine symporter family protein [Photobacterium sp. GB-27]PSV36985.1 sodium:alanine symporter family protein [Photobacterium sp. GB-210]PSV44003.1 sodium:alanine symporter family protein [Photobacterium sp. GB-36]
MSSQITFLNDLLWGSVLIYLLIGVGIYFTYRLSFIQFRHFGHMFKVMKNSRKSDSAGISSFQALCTSLAARVGTGNMAGVAVALTLGGPGAIFWMWLIAMLGMATAFAESALAQLYKTRDNDGNYRGGPAYYMEKGLGMRWMGVMFSVFLIIAFGLVFNSVQANSISQAAHVAFGWSPIYVGIGLVIMTGVIIFGGLRTIARTAEILVPAMALCYLVLALYIMAINIEKLPDIIMMIFRSAFGLEEAASGALGYTIAQGMINGLKRGLFSNEAGMGSAPNAAASATPYPPHPASQGYVQMLGVFMDTMVICSSTVAIILMSGEYVPHSEVTGIELTQRALSSQVGDWGSVFIAVAIFFFAFTSLVANYSYAETNLIFLEHNHKIGLNIFRVVVLFMVMFGALADLPTVWAMADVSMGMMALINLVAIVLLSGTVVKLATDYNKQLSLGKVPTFDSNDYPELHAQLEEGIWDKSKS